MILIALLFLLILAFILIELSLRTDYNFIFMLFAGLLFIWAGIETAGSGVDIQSGIFIQNINDTITNLTFIYSNYSSGAFDVLGIMFLGIGMFLFFFSIFNVQRMEKIIKN